MRLSTAIALGRMTVKEWLVGKLEGCALGMAGNSLGLTSAFTGGMFTYVDLEAEWPWLRNRAEHCPEPGCIKIETNLLLIAHLFDSHIADPPPFAKRWTLDQLIDFVRTIEPKEEEDASETRSEHEEVAVRKDPGVLSHSRHRGS